MSQHCSSTMATLSPLSSVATKILVDFAEHLVCCSIVPGSGSGDGDRSPSLKLMSASAGAGALAFGAPGLDAFSSGLRPSSGEWLEQQSLTSTGCCRNNGCSSWRQMGTPSID